MLVGFSIRWLNIFVRHAILFHVIRTYVHTYAGWIFDTLVGFFPVMLSYFTLFVRTYVRWLDFRYAGCAGWIFSCVMLSYFTLFVRTYVRWLDFRYAGSAGWIFFVRHALLFHVIRTYIHTVHTLAGFSIRWSALVGFFVRHAILFHVISTYIRSHMRA